MLPGNTRNTATNGKGQQGRQKRSHVPFPRGGRHFGGDAIPDSNYIAHPPPDIKQSATESQKHTQTSQPTDTSLLSANFPHKDKRKHLFPWSKKKSRTDLNTLSQGLSNTVGVSTAHTTPYSAAGGNRMFGNSSMPSLVSHPQKQPHEYDSRAQHPLDTQAMDDYFPHHVPVSQTFVHGVYDERRKPPILQSHRKAKEREKSDSSVLTTGSRHDDVHRPKESMDLTVDQDFGSMDEILNPEYRHLANGYIQPRTPVQDIAEQWAPPDSWGVQPAEGSNTPEVPPSIMDDDPMDYDEYSVMEPEKYNGPKRNYCIRIFRSDGTFATLQLPLTTTAGEIVQKLASKFFMRKEIGQLCLRLKRRNLERVLQPWERPLQIQKTLLEHMGYTEQDNIADVGREDNSYLLRFVFGLDTAQMLPKEIEYGNKQHIDLQARNLPTVPVFLYDQAASIISLDLSKNLHMDIPVDFLRNCRQLKQLWLADNEYTAIPPSVHHVSGLEHLNISGNRLRDLQHARLDEIPGLKTMRAYNNRLEKLPNSFAIFKQMTMLSIANNNFTSFPDVICEMVSLTHLDVSFNKIDAFPDEISNLKNLTRLFAIANRFAGSLPHSFAQLENLRELDIRQNSINDLDVLCRLPRLEILYVGYNAVSIVGCEFKSLRQLKMTKNHLTQFNLGVCRRSSEEPPAIHSNVPASISVRPESSMLTELDLSSCMLSSLPDDVFLGVPNLEELILDSNTLNSIPASIGTLRKLVRLSLQNNFLDSLPSEISNLTELKILDAQKNNLKMLPNEIWLCPSLQTLNCSSNLLEAFPKPCAAPNISLHLPGAASDSALASVMGGVVPDKMIPTTLGGHAGQGIVPGNRPLPDGDSTHSNRSMDDSTTVSGNSGLQSPPNFNPPSFFASPRNHPPPLSLSLRRLFLGDNRLTNEIWSPLMLFLELRTLNLSFNDLDEIPPEHLCHQHLYELYLSGNHLTSLPADDIEKLSYLRVLAVNGNKLQTLPAEIGKLRKLLVLDVGNNVLKYNISNWPYDWNWNWNLGLKFLNLSGNKRLEIKKTHPETHAPGEKDLADFSALTRLRMLGLMDVTILGVSIPEESPDRRVRTSPSEVNNMGYGVADWIGTNEHLATWDLVMPRFRNKDDECIFGLFDGCKSTRFGSKLTKYLNDHLTYHVMNELRKNKQDDTVVTALRRAFLSLEKGLGVSVSEDIDTGASAVVCYIAGTKLYVANVGDAMAVISRNNGQAFEITNKHIAINPSEISRIRAAGGFVSNSGKVNGELVVSRGFGYFDLVPIVNANPYIASIDLTENDEFVIMASRGLWERMNYQTAVDIARTEKDDFMAAAQKLRDFAITYGAEKDLMVMVIGVGDLFDKRDKRFRWRPGRATATAEAGILLDDVSLGTGGMLVGKNKRRVKEEAPGDSTLARLDREVPPPINQVVLVFTDIKSSTMLWETQPENMRSAIKIHDAVMRRTLRNVGGYEVKTEGDAFMVCFQNIVSALLWCFTVQLQLLEADWPAGILATEEGREIEKDGTVIYRGLSVRMGVHYGTPVFERNPITKRMDYFGPVVNKASRICNAADGGQICVSSDVVAALRNIPGMLDDSAAATDELSTSVSTYLLSRDIQQLKSLGFQVVELGMRKLKGLETPEMLSLVFPKKLAGRMEMEERLPILDEQASGLMKSTPGSPRLTTADTSLATSPRMGPDMSLEPSRVPTPTEDIEVVETPANEKQEPLGMQDVGRLEPAKPAQHAIDPALVNSLCSLAIRLERLTTGHTMARSPAQQGVRLSPRQGYTATVFTDTSSSEYASIGQLMEHHIMNNASDEELVILMENFVTRIENAASSLYLNKVGRFANVLEKLGEAIEVDPMHILRALQMFSEVAGLADMPTSLAASPHRS